ncbi:AGAP009040-PA [Anopheles gambiae str. PEST]|uniref:AGAP009040-PA n=2 Tax=gambiae species complex TaxID=44542 RepID=A0NGC5_ANOGA|nr:AGAP009040-PA [Anopheles gambiae str. PEST]
MSVPDTIAHHKPPPPSAKQTHPLSLISSCKTNRENHRPKTDRTNNNNTLTDTGNRCAASCARVYSAKLKGYYKLHLANSIPVCFWGCVSF